MQHFKIVLRITVRQTIYDLRKRKERCFGLQKDDRYYAGNAAIIINVCWFGCMTFMSDLQPYPDRVFAASTFTRFQGRKLGKRERERDNWARFPWESR